MINLIPRSQLSKYFQRKPLHGKVYIKENIRKTATRLRIDDRWKGEEIVLK